MKKSLLLFLCVSVLFIGCKDQINAPAANSTSERIVFTTIDLSNPSTLPQVASTDSSGANRIDMGLGYLFGTSENRMIWAGGNINNPDSLEFFISDNVGGSRLLLNSLVNSKERLYGFGTPAFHLSSDGTHIAYSTEDTTDNSYHLYVVTADGKNKVEITNEFDYQTNVCFSPDGTKIAYYRESTAMPSLGKTIEISATDGSSHYTLTTISRTASGVDGQAVISWSKKDKIAYYDNDSTFIISADGAAKVSLGYAVYAQWSPTGDTLAYTGANSDILLTSDYGLTTTNITNSPGIWEGYAHWSADGSRLLITRWIGDISHALLTLEEYNLSSGTNKIIASPGAFGYYVK